jgi:hypothetical protein
VILRLAVLSELRGDFCLLSRQWSPGIVPKPSDLAGPVLWGALDPERGVTGGSSLAALSEALRNVCCLGSFCR